MALLGMPLLYGLIFGVAWLAGLLPGVPWLYPVLVVLICALPAAANVGPSTVLELKSDRHPTVVLSAVAIVVAAVGFAIVAPGHALAARGEVETCAVSRFDRQAMWDEGSATFAVLACPSGRESTTSTTFDVDVGDRVDVAFQPDDAAYSLPLRRPMLDTVERVAWASGLVVVASHLTSGLWWLRNRRRTRAQ
ncbi:hypothetical protein [Amycolatopsis sp. NPDC051071]|uniref:hypothetical protein n=1 Tax=Amycolatopsis sp. NPDC051071 TaxID=3154637 RepID=UPI003441D8F3